MEAETTAIGSGQASGVKPAKSPAAIPHPNSHDDAPPRKKQKRNKPTLSCLECVERKTKCDRGRPQCIACLKRQSECRYSEVANLIATADSSRDVNRQHSSRPKKQPGTSVTGSENGSYSQKPTPRLQDRSASLTSTASSSLLLSHIPNSTQNTPLFFGLGSQHPFTNYWTSQGGLPEVVGVLPSKDQADILVAKFFDAVDPVYPMIHKRNFHTEYERFWTLSLHEKQVADPSLLALHFVVYAMGTQFIQTPSDHERAQISEFYVSAAHQALRLASYLSRTSVKAIQAMVLICYFLMNDNHASDAWGFGGVLTRQAYAMGLNRDPDIMCPRCSLSERQQRRKVWQAVLFQDTFLTVLLKLPPTTTFSDVRVDSLTDDLDDNIGGVASSNGGHETVINPMSIDNIAPASEPHPRYELSDRQYIRSMWKMANLVQQTVCIPRSLNHPLTSSPDDKVNLINIYREMHDMFPPALRASDHETISGLADSNARLLRQNLFCRSNFYHCVMIIQADVNNAEGVSCNVKGALDAARMALASFFDFWEFLRVDASVWFHFQARALEEALLIARILSAQNEAMSPAQFGIPPGSDPLFILAKVDVRKTLDILELVGSVSPEMQKTRTDVLRSAFEDITW